MPLINYSIPSLIGGVTQQPSNLAYPGQAKVLENAWPSVTDGLQKRYPTEYHGKLSGADFNKTHKIANHFIDKSTDERYLVTVNGGAVWDGSKYPRRLRTFDLLDVSGGLINTPVVRMSRSGYDYLDSTNPDDYRFQTIGDVTFVVNRSKVPAKLADTGPTSNKQAILYVRSTLASNAHEDVVVTFNGASTVNIREGDASSTLLAYNIYAALTGADASQGAHTVSKHSNKFLKTSHGIAANTAIKVAADTFPTYRVSAYDEEDGTFYYSTKSISAETVLYVRDVESNAYKVSFQPGGDALDWVTEGSNIVVTSIGTGSPPTGFEKLVVQGSPDVTSVLGGGATSHNVGNVLLLSHLDGEDFSIEVRDAAGNSLVDVYKDSAPSFSELPDTAVDGFALQIRNDPATGLDDYWVKFVADSGNPGELSSGYWTEIATPGGQNKLDPRTMPHILVRTPDPGGGLPSFAFMPGGEAFSNVVGLDNENDRLEIQIAPTGVISTYNTELLADGDEVTLSDISEASGLDLVADKLYYVKAISTATGNTQTIELYHDSGLSDKVTFTFTDGVSVFAVLRAKAEYPQFVWNDRQAGGEVTNPDPTFVGTPIEDVSFFKNRLAFAAGENFVLSELGEFFNFYRTTVTQLLETAPIDVASSWAGVANINRLVPYGQGLLGLAPNVQFFLKASGSQAFGASTVSIDVVSNLSTAPVDAAAPQLMGSSLYLPFTRGDYVGMYEYKPDNTGVFSNDDVTSHVPQYVEGPLRDIAVLEKEKCMVLLGTKAVTDGYKNTNELYVYKTLALGEKRVQSAWTKYTFHGADIRAIHFYDNELYIMSCRTVGEDDSWWIDKISFKTGRTDTDSTYVTHLDRRFKYTVPGGDYDAANGWTNIGAGGEIYPFEWENPMEAVTTDGELLPNLNSRVDGQIRVMGDMTGKVVWVGEKYTMKCKMHTQYVRQNTGSRGVVALVAGRTQLRTGTLMHADSVYFNVQVTPLNRDPYNYTYNGRELGAGRLSVGAIPTIEAGAFKFPLYGKNEDVDIEITNDSPFPSNLVGAEIEALYHSRSGRVS